MDGSERTRIAQEATEPADPAGDPATEKSRSGEDFLAADDADAPRGRDGTHTGFVPPPSG